MADYSLALKRYLKSKGLKLTRQRLIVLRVFLDTGRHVTSDDLYGILKKRRSGIGHATVFRTLKLMCDAGIAGSVNLEGGVTRYEPKLGKKEHCHLICRVCGKVIEAYDPEIEKVQRRLAGKKGFDMDNYRLRIFGVCRDCRRRKGNRGKTY